MSAMMRSVLMFNGNLGNSLWLMALGGPVGRCVSVMLNKNIYTEVGGKAWGGEGGLVRLQQYKSPPGFVFSHR